jgi:hypothetical protein
VFESESVAGSFIRARIAKGTVVNADEANSWDSLHDRFEMRRIDHSQVYSFEAEPEMRKRFDDARKKRLGLTESVVKLVTPDDRA